MHNIAIAVAILISAGLAVAFPTYWRWAASGAAVCITAWLIYAVKVAYSDDEEGSRQYLEVDRNDASTNSLDLTGIQACGPGHDAGLSCGNMSTTTATAA